MSNPFNPQWLGFSPATDKQIIGGSAPFVYYYMPHDSQSCITAKSLFNTAHSAMYTPDSIVRSHPASNIMQSTVLHLWTFKMPIFCDKKMLGLGIETK